MEEEERRKKIIWSWLAKGFVKLDNRTNQPFLGIISTFFVFLLPSLLLLPFPLFQKHFGII